MAYSENDILEALNTRNTNTLMETLEISFIQYKNGKLTAKMPVTSKVMQPFGYLHGGATISLMETVASVVSILSFENPLSVSIFGTQLSVNHLNSAKKGNVMATAEIIKAGKSQHIIKVEVVDEEGTLISICTQTNSIKFKD